MEDDSKQDESSPKQGIQEAKEGMPLHLALQLLNMTLYGIRR
jgi:hypothetical protein